MLRLASDQLEQLQRNPGFPVRVSPKIPQSVVEVMTYVVRYPDFNDTAIILDKRHAVAYAISEGKVVGVSRFLSGARLDDQFPGGSMGASYSLPIPLELKKVTPAGAFPIARTHKDPNYGTSLTFALYKDYRLAIHRVNRDFPEQRRPERLLSPRTNDKSISFGCVNVTDEFYDSVLWNLKITARSHLYIIPYDTTRTREFLPMIFGHWAVRK